MTVTTTTTTKGHSVYYRLLAIPWPRLRAIHAVACRLQHCFEFLLFQRHVITLIASSSPARCKRLLMSSTSLKGHNVNCRLLAIAWPRLRAIPCRCVQIATPLWPRIADHQSQVLIRVVQGNFQVNKVFLLF